MRLLARLALVAVSTLLTLALCEVAVRALNLGPEIAPVSAGIFRLSPNPVLQYDLAPGTHEGGVKINADGMRDRRYPRAKPPGTFRIAVIGDSITYGFGVGNEQTYPELLERLLATHVADGTDYEVLNFGVAGYSVPEIVESLRVKALLWDPDLVIYGYCLNDPELYNPFIRLLRARLEGRERGYLERLADGRLRLWALASYAVESSRRPDPETIDEQAIWNDDPGYLAIHSGARVYESYIRRMHDAAVPWGAVTAGLDRLREISESDGIPVAVAVFPLMRRLEPYSLGPVHRKLVRAIEERGLLAVDLTRPFVAASADPRWRGNLGRDRVHPSPVGHGIAALALLYWLLDNDLLPGAEAAVYDSLESEGPAAALVRAATLSGGAQP